MRLMCLLCGLALGSSEGRQARRLGASSSELGLGWWMPRSGCFRVTRLWSAAKGLRLGSDPTGQTIVLAPIWRRSVAYLCLTQVRLVAERSCCKGFAAIKTRENRSDRPLPRSFAALCGFAGEGSRTGAAQLKSLKSGCIAGLVQVPILVS